MRAYACAAATSENPFWRSVARVASCRPSDAAPGAVRFSISAIAHGCRRSASRAEPIRREISTRHAPVGSGSSISLNTRSTSPSRISSLLAT